MSLIYIFLYIFNFNSYPLRAWPWAGNSLFKLRLVFVYEKCLCGVRVYNIHRTDGQVDSHRLIDLKSWTSQKDARLTNATSDGGNSIDE